MEEVTLKRTGQRHLRFIGTKLASYATSMNNNHPDYSGQTGISHRAEVYQTEAGKYVLRFSIYSAWQGSTDNHIVFIHENSGELLRTIEAELPELLIDELMDQLQESIDVVEEIG